MKILNLLAVTLTLLSLTVAAQEEKVPVIPAPETPPASEHRLYLGSDLVSRYVWRGTDYGNSPAVQPTLGFLWKGFDIGVWGSYAFAAQKLKVNDTLTLETGPYAEVDLYLSYTWKWFTLLAYDYFAVNPESPNSDVHYFDYASATTGHTFEGSLIFEGPEKFPLKFIVATLLYGADKGKDSTGIYGLGTKNNYSTYLELSYPFMVTRQNIELKPFIGGIPFGSSWYGPKAGIINLGLSAAWPIPAGKKFSIPATVSLITNPQAQSVFLVFSLSLNSSNYVND